MYVVPYLCMSSMHMCVHLHTYMQYVCGYGPSRIILWMDFSIHMFRVSRVDVVFVQG